MTKVIVFALVIVSVFFGKWLLGQVPTAADETASELFCRNQVALMVADISGIESILQADKRLADSIPNMFCRKGRRILWLLREYEGHSSGSVIKSGYPLAVSVTRDQSVSPHSKIAMAIFSIEFVEMFTDSEISGKKSTLNKQTFIRMGKQRVHSALVSAKKWLNEYSTFKSIDVEAAEADLILAVPDSFEDYLQDNHRYLFAPCMTDKYWEEWFDRGD